MFKAASAGQGTGAAAPAIALNIQGGGNAVAASGEKIGRNEPCPCGSGKKYKKCGLLNTEEHQRNMAAGGKKHEVTGG